MNNDTTTTETTSGTAPALTLTTTPKKASVWARLETDPAAENDGVWVRILEDEAPDLTLEVRVRSAECLAARKVNADFLRQHDNLSGDFKWILPPELQDELDLALCAVLVADWRGDWTNPDTDEPWPFSTENLRVACERIRAVRRDILLAARARETYRKAALAAIKGN